MPFTPGHSGNPLGRPPGSRNKATLVAEAAFAERIERVFEAVLQRAEQGHLPSARLVLRMMMPATRSISFEMPPLTSLADVAQALSGLLAAVAAGEVTPQEAAGLGRLIQVQARLLEKVAPAVAVPQRRLAAPEKIQRNTMGVAAVTAESDPLAALTRRDQPPADRLRRTLLGSGTGAIGSSLPRAA